MNKLFNGEVARITGGSSGIGRATAILFAAEGARVVVASRRAEESQETVRLIQAAGGDAMFVKTDVSKAAEAEAMVAATVQRMVRCTSPSTTPASKAHPSCHWSVMRKAPGTTSLASSSRV